MPTYDYICSGGHKTEIFCNVSEFKKSVKCISTIYKSGKKQTKCGKKAVAQMGNGIGAIFKGKGFHNTDYK